MQNQRLPKIDMATSKLPRSRFNFSHDVNTTAEFGVVQPAMCTLMVPGSKTTMSTESLTRLAPLVVPTFGRLKYKLWHQFIECRDICEQFDAMMAQQPIYSASDKITYQPNSVPMISLGALSSLCFIGARCTAYKKNAGSNGWDTTYEAFNTNHAGYNVEFKGLVEELMVQGSDGLRACPVAYRYSDAFVGTSQSYHLCLNLCESYSASFSRVGISNQWAVAQETDSLLSVPLANTYYSSYSDGRQYRDLGYIYDTNGRILNNPVTIDGADYLFDFDGVYEGTLGHFTLAFKFSDFGKRIRKIIIGSGLQLDLTSSTKVSMLPLFAVYKAYWNLFSLTQWKDWQQTNCACLIRLLNRPNTDVGQLSSDNAEGYDLLNGFIRDLGALFITESSDFVSSHLLSTAVSPAVGNLPFVDVTGNDAVTEVDSSGGISGSPVSGNGHSFINQIEHGHLDEEYLKRLYKWTNRNTVIGRRIADLLRAQGLGKFVDESKSNFIGYTEDVVQISDVVSTADTMSSSGGASLGEFGGKGVQYTKGKSFTYENEVYGYWVTLCAIVPESGYSQQIDARNFAIDKFHFYNPEFDSLGYDLTRKQVIQGAKDTNEGGDDLKESFGYKPRYFEWKFKNNITNGDMSLRSVRDNYLPYFLDRFIVLNDKYIQTDSSDLYKQYCKNLFTSRDLPVAGNQWRYPTRYSWLGNLKRMFLSYGKKDNIGILDQYDLGSEWRYFCTSHYDDFLIHNIFDVQCFAPMLAVEDSFETTDDGEKSDMSVSKA